MTRPGGVVPLSHSFQSSRSFFGSGSGISMTLRLPTRQTLPMPNRPDPRRVTLVSLATMVAAVAPVHLFGALAPKIQAELGFGDTEQGIAIGIFFAVAAGFAMWGGSLTDRIGPSPALRLAAVATAIGATVGMLAPSYSVIVLALILVAVGNGISQPGNNTFISGGVPAHRRGIALGVKQAAIPTSTGLAGLALPTIADSLGWRWAYAFTIMLALAALAAIPHVEPPARRRTREESRAFRPSKGLVLVAAASASGAAAVASIGAFLVRSAQDAGFSVAGAGYLQVIGSVALISTRVGWGALMDRVGISRFAFSTGLMIVGGFGFPLLATGDHRLMVVGAILAYGAGWSWPGVVHLGTVEHHPHATGSASGIVQAAMFSGAMIGPVLFGAVAEHASFGWAWMISAGFISVAAMVMAMATRELDGPRRSAEPVKQAAPD